MQQINQAVILAGGQGKRLRAFSGTTPKPIADVGGVPFVRHLLRQLAAYGVRKAVLLCGYEAQQIVDAQEQFQIPQVELTIVVGDETWGTAERLANAADFLEPDFLLMYSDNYFQFDVERLISRYRDASAALALNCVPREGGNVVVEAGGSARYLPKDSAETGSFVELGYMIVNRDQFAPYLSKSAKLPDVLAAATADLPTVALTSQLSYWSISDPDRRRLTEEFLKPKPILILDRDGVLNERPPIGEYVGTWADFRWRTDAIDCLERLAARGLQFVVASNQAGIARGRLTIDDAHAINRQMLVELRARGIEVVDKAICPHGFDDGCTCRKPSPGMLLELSGRNGSPLVDSYFIGDDIRDVETSIRAGCNAAFVGTEPSSDQERRLLDRGLDFVGVADFRSENDLWAEVGRRVLARVPND